MTARPARIAEIVDVDFERPRTEKMQFLPKFGAYVGSIGETIAGRIGKGGAMPGLSGMARLCTLARDWGQPVATFVALLLLWEAAGKIFGVPIWLLPTPTDILSALIERRSDLFQHAWITFYETILGFFLAIALGVPLAVAVTYSRRLSNTVYPLILVTQSVPKVAFAPILLIWLGYGDFPKIIVAFLVAFFPVVVDTATGLRSPSPQLLDLARQLSASQFQVYTKIRFPSALPHFFSGIKLRSHCR